MNKNKKAQEVLNGHLVEWLYWIAITLLLFGAVYYVLRTFSF